MTGALKLLKQQQANNREQFAMRSQLQSKQDLYKYIGFDANTGTAIASNGANTIQAGRITNGAIKPNQPVKTVQSGNRIVIDAMPHPKPEAPQIAPQTNYPIKLVSAKREANRIEYFVTAIALNGQCKFNSRPVYTFEVDEALQLERMFTQIDSTGNGESDWILSIAHVHAPIGAFGTFGDRRQIPTELYRTQLGVNFQQATFTIATIRKNRTWELNSNDDPRITALFFDTFGYSSTFYKGHGFWAIAACKQVDGIWQQLTQLGTTQPDQSFAWYEGERLETTPDQMLVLPEVAIALSPEFRRFQISYCAPKLQTALVVGESSQNKQRNLIVSADTQTEMELNNSIEAIDADPFPERLSGVSLDFNLESLIGFASRGNYIRDVFYCLLEPTIHQPATEEGAKQRKLLLYEFSRQESFILRRKRSINVRLPIPDDHLRGIPGVSFGIEPTIETISASYYP